MPQIAINLSSNEMKLTKRIPVGEGDFRALGVLSAQETKLNPWFWGCEKFINRSLSQYVREATAMAVKGKVYVQPKGWRRLKPSDRGNPENSIRKRYTLSVSDECRAEIEKLQVRAEMNSLADTIVWLMENYSQVLRFEGIQEEIKVRKKKPGNRTAVFTVHLSVDDSDEIKKIAKENQIAAGRVLSDYISYCMKEYGIHGIAAKMYPGDEDEVTEVIDMAEPEGFKKAIDLMLPTVDDTYHPEDTMDVATGEVTSIDPDGFDPEAFGL